MSLIHWWPLNGDTKDYGLLNNDLIRSQGVTFVESGKFNKSASFSNGYLAWETSNSSTKISKNITLSAWVYLPSIPTSASIINCFESGGCGLYISSKSMTMMIWDGSSYKSAGFSPSTGWHHYVGTFDGNDLKIYGDGILKATTSLSNATIVYNATTPWMIGANPNAAGNPAGDYLNGQLNDVRMYDHVLSVKEIRDLAKALVLHYDFEDPYIEATTNLATANLSNTCYNGAKGTYNYGTSTDMYKDDGFYEGKQCTRVHMGTDGASAYPYVYFNQFDSAGTNIRTLSFDYFPTTQTTLIPYSYNGTYNWSFKTDTTSGSATNVSTCPVITGLKLNTWNHITVTASKYDTTSSTRGIGYIRIGSSAHTSSTSNYWLFANVQVEAKDHETGYTPLSTSRAASPVYDSSGYNNNGIPTDIQIIPNTSYDYACSGQYAALFDGNTSVVQTPSLANLIHDGIYSISVNFYVSDFGSKTYGTIYGGPSGFEIESKRGSTNSPLLVAYSWGQNSTGGQIYDLNKWNHLIMTRTASETKWYLNGVLWYTGTAGAIPAGDYFIGAWKTATQQNFKGRISDFKIYATALSAEDVLKEYQRKAAIDKNGNIFTGRFIETTIQSVPKVNKNDTFSASSLSEGLITQVLSDGSIWERIYYFDYDIAGVVWTKATAQSNNTLGRFSILGSLNSYVPKSGWYEFYYKEKNSTSTNDIRWKQSFNPLSRVTSGVSGTSSEYTFISGTTPYSSFAGLTRYSSNDESTCYLRGAPSWWCAIAPYQTSYDVFPDMWGNSINNHHQELWIRIDDMIATPTYSNTQAKLNSTSIMCASAHET